MGGELAGALAYALRRKREAETENADRWDRTLQQRTVNQERGEERQYQRDQAQQDRERQAERDAMQRQLMELQLLEGQHRVNQTGPYAPKPERDPVAEYDARLGVEERRGVGAYAPREPRAPQRDPIADYKARLELDQQYGNGGGRALPSSAALRLGSLGNLAHMAEQAETSLKAAMDKGVNATGAVLGRASGLLRGMGRLPSEAVSAQASLANVASEIMKARSGGAVTPQEFERLEPFLPSINEDEHSALQKLQDLRNYLRQSRESELESLEQAGYNVGRFRPAPPTDTAQQFPENPYR